MLTFVAFARGVWGLGAKSLWWDESLSLHRARQDGRAILAGRIVLTDNVETLTTIDDHPPLYFLILSGAVRLFGQIEFALRFPSAASVVLLVPLLYATGRRVAGRRIGMAAAALGALSPMYLWYGQEARMYALLTVLGLLSFYSLGRAFLWLGSQTTDSSIPIGEGGLWRGGRVPRTTAWLAAYVVTSLGVVAVHYLGILVIAFELVVVGWAVLRAKQRRRAAAGALVLALLVALIVFGYVLLTAPQHIGPGESRAGFSFVPLPTLLRDLLNSFSLGLSVDIGKWYVLGGDVVFLGLLLLGFARLARHGSSAWLLAGYLCLPVLLVYLLSYVQPVYMNSRHLMLASPAFYLLVAAGLTGWRGRAALIGLLAWGIVIAGMGYSTHNYFAEPAYDKDQHRAWGDYLRQHVRPGDVVVVDPPHIAELYGYYARSGVPWIGLPLLERPIADTEARLADLLARYDRIWLALSHTPPWGDPDRVPERWLNENAFRFDYQGFGSYGSAVLVAGYLPAWPSVDRLPDDAQPVEVRYSRSLRLMGYRIVSPALPGRWLHVELFWGVDKPQLEQVKVILRLVNDRGHLWGYGEQCPFNGLYPMWQWLPGQILRDEREVYIEAGTPPGSYQLELLLGSVPDAEGCWRATLQKIVPAVAPVEILRGDAVSLGTVNVGRTEVVGRLDVEQRRSVRFDGLRWLGSSLSATEVEPGTRVSLALHWEALQPSLPDLQFLLTLVDSAGTVWQERAIRPVGDAYPTSDWQSEDRLRGQFWLAVPADAPAGRYELRLSPLPPLRRAGPWSALRRWLGLEEQSLRIGWLTVGREAPREEGTPVPTPPLPARDLGISRPMVATLGDQVRFLGYDLDRDAVRGGDTFSLTLYWQALRSMGLSYTVFTHLLGSDGEVAAQRDNVPQGGRYPTTRWQVGEIVSDTYAIAVGPQVAPGSYLLEVGMYRLETGERLAVVGAEGQPLANDRIVLANVSVLPTYRLYLPLIEAGGE